MAVRMLGSCHWIVGTSEAFVANAHDFGEAATLFLETTCFLKLTLQLSTARGWRTIAYHSLQKEAKSVYKVSDAAPPSSYGLNMVNP